MLTSSQGHEWPHGPSKFTTGIVWRLQCSAQTVDVRIYPQQNSSPQAACFNLNKKVREFTSKTLFENLLLVRNQQFGHLVDLPIFRLFWF